jgi:SH3-like domain-containing protein
MRCREDWCRVEVAGLRGWISRDNIWGVYEGEKVD